MFSVDLAYPFTLGLVAAFNPCGFAMLPVYVSFFLGKDSERETSTGRNVLRAISVGAALTLGFVVVFGTFGILTAGLLSRGAVLENTPYVTFGLGLLLVPLGIAMLRGFELKIPTPRLDKGGESGEVFSMFLFGISYAIVSLSCTVGIFIAGVSSVFTSTGFVDGVAVFVVYALGMGAVIMTLTVGLALARTSVATNMRKLLPWINRISGVLLVISGAYLATYGWWEIQVLRGNLSTNRLVSFVEDVQTNVNVWIAQTGPTRLGIGLLILVAAALVRGIWTELSTKRRPVAVGALAAGWLSAEFVRYDADLFVLPVIRTIGDLPERLGNWFSSPIRWAVLGEMFVIAALTWTAWFRVRRLYHKRRTVSPDSRSALGSFGEEPQVASEFDMSADSSQLAYADAYPAEPECEARSRRWNG